MPLIEVDYRVEDGDLPAEVLAFLREADRRIEEFQRHARVPAFVASDFPRVYRVLCAAADGLAPGNLFCEWGSGFGVVACLAAMVGFDAVGIEIDANLVEAARELAADFDLSVEFIRGTFIPAGSHVEVGDFAWLDTVETGLDVDLAPDDFDVVFAYPWPDEEHITEALFARHADAGALLLTYHDSGDVRLRRKRRR